MNTRVYKLYAAGSATTNDASHLDIQGPGHIVAISACVRLDGGSDNDCVEAELSFASASQIAVNDSIGPIFSAAVRRDLTTSGSSNQVANASITGIAIPVRNGDRLYVNTLVPSGTPAYTVNLYVHVAGR